MAQIKTNLAYGVTGTIPTANIADDAITAAKIADNAVVTAAINADAVTDAKVADDVIGTEHLTAGEVDTTALGADSVTAAKIGDNILNSEHYAAASIDNEHIADDAIDSEHYVDGSIDLAHMSSESVDEDNLQISNAGSNGEYLQKQSGNTGGLTWASVSSGASLSNDANNRVVTADGSGGLNGEANLTFDGTDLTVGAGTIIVEDCGAKIGGANLYGQGASDAFYTNVDDPNTGMHLGDTDRLYLVTGGNKALSIEADQECRFTANGQSANTDGSYSFDLLRTGWSFKIRNHVTSGSPSAFSMEFPSHSGNIGYFQYMADSTSAKMYIHGSGAITSAANSYGAISDERIKQDITDANSQWDDIKGLRVRNFRRKDEVRGHGEAAQTQIGLVAQETEVVSPNLIFEAPPTKFDIVSDSAFGTLWTADDPETQDEVLFTADDQEVIEGNKNIGDIKTPATAEIGDVKTEATTVKTMKYSVLYMKAIKCLQEAQTRIETLEAKITALENA